MHKSQEKPAHGSCGLGADSQEPLNNHFTQKLNTGDLSGRATACELSGSGSNGVENQENMGGKNRARKAGGKARTTFKSFEQLVRK